MTDDRAARDRGGRELAPRLAAESHPYESLRSGRRRSHLERARGQRIDQRREHSHHVGRAQARGVQVGHHLRQPARDRRQIVG